MIIAHYNEQNLIYHIYVIIKWSEPALRSNIESEKKNKEKKIGLRAVSTLCQLSYEKNMRPIKNFISSQLVMQ